MDDLPVVVGETNPQARPRILVIAPHADDEAFGCGGMLARQAAQGAALELLVVGMGGLHHKHLAEEATFDMRMTELVTASEILGVQRYSVLYPGMDMRLDTIPQLEMVSKLDGILDQGDYDEVFFPYPSHNHDHRAVQQACIAALRPGARFPGPSLIAMYEYTYSGWSPVIAPGGRLYVDITETMDAKRRAAQAYASQLRSYPSPVSLKAMELVAGLRGTESNCQYAELYHIIQMTRR